MFKLISFLKPYKKECILGPIFKLIEAILELLLPTIMVFMINKGVKYHNSGYVIKIGIIMFFMAVLGYCSALVCQYFASRASQGFGTTLRNTLFERISKFSYAEVDNLGTASLTNRITNDVNQLQLAVAMLIRLVIRAPFICIGALIMAMLLDFRLAIVMLISTPIVGIILYFIITRTSPMYSKYQKRLDNIARVLRENFSGVRVIRAFAKINYEKNRFYKANGDLAEMGMNVGKISALLNPLTSLVMNMAIVAVLWVGGIHINAGTLSQGTIIAFVNYMTQITLALIVVSNLVIIFTKAAASAERVNEILSTYPSIEDGGEISVGKAEKEIPAIEFDNVSFGYSSTGDTVLENVSLTIGKGETIGIIGGTGSGKSTFINLIPRFYEATKGAIRINGNNVKDYRLLELRKKIAIVPQKALLFTGTIEENIKWGRENATSEEVIKASEIAQAHEFIKKLPKGYGEMVERGGTNFSGGQKQRITIARALASKPEILILDDSFSALDLATDRELRKAINANFKDTTVLLVSQRANTIKEADKILVFDDGHIVGMGKHEELLKSCEVYKEICISQNIEGADGVDGGEANEK